MNSEQAILLGLGPSLVYIWAVRPRENPQKFKGSWAQAGTLLPKGEKEGFCYIPEEKFFTPRIWVELLRGKHMMTLFSGYLLSIISVYCF